MISNDFTETRSEIVAEPESCWPLVGRAKESQFEKKGVGKSSGVDCASRTIEKRTMSRTIEATSGTYPEALLKKFGQKLF